MPTDRIKTADADAGIFVGSNAQRLAGWSIGMALLSTALLLDPLAEAGFDAPKRLGALLAVVIASAAMVWDWRRPAWQAWSRQARWIAVLALLGLLGCVVSAFASPHPEQAWNGLRTLVLFSLFVPLGGSALLAGPFGGRLLRIAIFAVGFNALLSLLQAAGLKLPIEIAKLGGRLPTGALLGNEGYVALACALMSAACLAFALNVPDRRQRLYALACCVLGIVAIAVNQQLTSAIALGAAALAIAAVRWRVRYLVPLGAALVALAMAAAVAPPIRALTWGALPVGGAEGYQRLTTYRLGAWVSALEMISNRPLAGYGPGTYAAEAHTQRMAAEIRLRQRLGPPVNAGAFGFAHQDYLQFAAETGIPSLLAILGALGMLVAGLLGLARSPGPAEPLALLGVLIAGAVAALAWFPMQIPLTAVLLLLACGRAWRLIADQAGRGT